MVTLTWIDGQIEKAIEEGNNPQNIRDLAALITVREYLATRSAPKADAQSVQESADDKKRRDAVALMTHSADLDTVPTIQQVETALHSISVNTPEERKACRMQRSGRRLSRRKTPDKNPLHECNMEGILTPVLTTSCDGKRVKIANMGIACSCLLCYNQALSMDCKATDISTIKTATSSSGKVNIPSNVESKSLTTSQPCI